MSLIWIQGNSRKKGFLTGYQLGLEAWLSGRRLANHRRGYCSSVSGCAGMEISFLVCNMWSQCTQPRLPFTAFLCPWYNPVQYYMSSIRTMPLKIHSYSRRCL